VNENNSITGILAKRYSLRLGRLGIEDQLPEHLTTGLRLLLLQSPMISCDRIRPDLNIGIDAKLTKFGDDIINMNFSHDFPSSVNAEFQGRNYEFTLEPGNLIADSCDLSGSLSTNFNLIIHNHLAH
jgi:hypothetical protein